MMEFALHPHPATPAAAVRAVRVRMQALANSDLSLVYEIDAPADSVLVPPPAAAQRRDELWRRSCFELFAAGEGDSYREFNLSPSGHWAIYDFSGYRTGMNIVNTATPPRVKREAQGLVFSAHIDASLLSGTRGGAAALSLTAVIESADSQLSYWALRHPPGKPDFHHRDGFVIAWPLAHGKHAEDNKENAC